VQNFNFPSFTSSVVTLISWVEEVLVGGVVVVVGLALVTVISGTVDYIEREEGANS
jgi:hypothetical protein